MEWSQESGTPSRFGTRTYRFGLRMGHLVPHKQEPMEQFFCLRSRRVLHGTLRRVLLGSRCDGVAQVDLLLPRDWAKFHYDIPCATFHRRLKTN